MTVSVIMPTYNYGKYLSESVGSVLSQSYTDLELIVIDDGSTDDTHAVLGRINDSRLKVISIENSGVSVARNAGLDAATGEYIAYLDADDRWLPTKLEKQVGLLDAEPSVSLVFTDFSRFDEDAFYPDTLFGYLPELYDIPRRAAVQENCYVLDTDTYAALASTGEMATWLQTLLLKAETIQNIRFPEGVRLCEDYHYMLRVYERVKAAYIDESLVEVRRHGSNSYTEPLQMLEPKVAAIEMVLRDTSNLRHRDILKRRLGMAWLGVGYANFWGGSISGSLSAYLKALTFKGSTWNALKHIVLLPVIPLVRKYRSRQSSQ